jgi:hypothetical protein
VLWKPSPQFKYSSAVSTGVNTAENFGLVMEALTLPELAGLLLLTSNETQSERKPAVVRNQGSQRVVFDI